VIANGDARPQGWIKELELVDREPVAGSEEEPIDLQRRAVGKPESELAAARLDGTDLGVLADLDLVLDGSLQPWRSARAHDARGQPISDPARECGV